MQVRCDICVTHQGSHCATGVVVMGVGLDIPLDGGVLGSNQLCRTPSGWGGVRVARLDDWLLIDSSTNQDIPVVL